MKSTTKKPANPKLNVKLLRKIQGHILEEPRRFFMADFVDTGKPGSRVKNRSYDQPATYPACGTTACIAGWANILTGATEHDAITDAFRARRQLGISFEVGLFSEIVWPDPFRDDYNVAQTAKQRAKIAAARIDHLIKTGE